MQALLLRVGADSGTGGGLGPIYEDGSFDYVPIPEAYETAEKRSYLDIDDSKGNPLADYVADEHRTDKVHMDPEFESYTYGDPTQKRSQLAKLEEDDLLVFYAGLQPADGSDHPRLYVIGYFTVAAVHDLEQMNESERSELFDRLPNNAHVNRKRTTPESKHPEKEAYPVIVEGKPTHSRLLDKARPLSDAYVSKTNPQYYMLDSVADITGYSADKDLTRASGRWLDPDDPAAFRGWLDDGVVGLVDDSVTARSYVLKHDGGFAPNVSSGYCTLATCKPRIRSSANEGDWVLGTGSLSKGDPEERLLYAMRVDEVLTYDEYFDDPRFEYKKPLDGELYDSDGDNIYYSGSLVGCEKVDESEEQSYFEDQTPDGATIYYTHDSEFVQIENPHHPPKRIPGDTPSSPDDQAVLVSRQFWYFGASEQLFPEDEILRKSLIKGYPGPNGKQGSKYEDDEPLISEFVRWLVENYRIGRHGVPRDAGESDPDHHHLNC